MENLTQYLNQILDWHTRLGSPLANSLLPGLSENEIRKKIAILPFKLPDEFIELYAWRNGTPASEPNWVSFVEYHRFLSLDEALDDFQMRYPIIKEYYEKTDWIMTFEDGSSDGYGISAIEKGKSPSVAPIVFLFEGDGVNTIFGSLTQMMKTMVACFESGVFTMGEDGDLETDFYKFGEIAYNLNPEINYWKVYVSYSNSK